MSQKQKQYVVTTETESPAQRWSPWHMDPNTFTMQVAPPRIGNLMPSYKQHQLSASSCW